MPLPSKRPGTQSGSGNRPLANVKIKEVLPHPDEPATEKGTIRIFVIKQGMRE